MAIPLNINGQTFDYPERGDQNWGPDATDWAQAVTSGMLQKAGGLFQLLAEVDFGSSYGLKSLYYKSRTSNVASAGQIRLAVSDSISFRNNANDGNLSLTINGSDQLEFDGNAFVTSGSIVNADISASAAIDWSKMANLTASRVLVSDVSGDVSASSVTSTTLGYLDATSSIQTQLDAKLPSAGGTISGNLVVSGDLTVNGTTTTLNTQTLDVEDKNIKVNFGGNDASSEGAGLTVVRTAVNGSIIYAAAAASKFKIGAEGSEVEVADISTAQTLTNKIISGSSNTLSNIAMASLATLTASKAVQTSAGGVLEASSVTSTELGYVSGVTSSIQTQLNAKATDPVVTTPGGYPYTAANAQIILVDTSSARTINLPSPTLNTKITIKDAVGSAGTNNITVARFASEQIEGVAANRVLAANWGAWTFVSNGTNWFMI